MQNKNEHQTQTKSCEKLDAYRESQIDKSNIIMKIYETDPRNADNEIAYWFVNLLPHMGIKEPASDFKGIYESYIKTTHEDRIRLLENNIFMEKVDHYKKAKESSESENKSNLFWLEWTIQTLPEKDKINRAKVQSVVDQLHSHLDFDGEMDRKYGGVIQELNRKDWDD